MITWILIAVIGGILSIWAFIILLRQYQQGKHTKRYIYAMVVGYVSFVLFALVMVIQPEFNSGIVSVAILMPAFVAIVVLVDEYRKIKKTE